MHRIDMNLQPIRVLLIEDSQDDAELILLELAGAGFDICCTRVETGAAMRAAIEGGSWDVAISDYSLPRFNAREALAVLREADADIPFLIVSGCIGEESAIALMKEGVSDFVMKDKLARLAPAIKRQLGEADMRRSHRKAQEALRANEKLLSGITAALGEGLLVLNNSGELLFMNPEAERLLGWTQSELSGRNVGKLAHSQNPVDICSPGFDYWLAETLNNGGIFRTEEDAFWRKDGTLMLVSIVVSAVMQNGEPVAAVVVFRDIGSRKQAERDLLESQRQLRELTSYLQTVREEERTRIARELHDELGQMLTGVKLDAMWLAAHLPTKNLGIANKVASMSRLIDETLDAMRRVASDLRPVMLDDLGLAAAVEWLAEDFGARTGINVHLDLNVDLEQGMCKCQEAGNLNPEVSTAAFRIVQECLTNVARHADAEHLLISLDCDDEKIMLLLSDDGKGLSPGNENKRDSYGIIGMRERAHGLGGRLNLFSIPGGGTAVLAILPVNINSLAGAPI